MRKSDKITKILGIDFETANRYRSSPCSLGFALLDAASGELIESKHFLINPHQDFDSFNIKVHGIKPEMVADAPSFEDVLPELAARIDAHTLVVAHNASFDMSVLGRTCEALDLTPPNMEYACTCVLSRILFPSVEKNTLTAISRACGLKPFDHHYAEDDAIACARIFCHFLKYADSAYDLLKKTGVRCGYFKDGYHKTCQHSDYAAACSIEIEPVVAPSPAKSEQLKNTISAKIIGSLVKNDDGTDRQALLAELHPGDSVHLVDMPDGSIGVFDSKNRQCGFLHKRISEFYRSSNADFLSFTVSVAEVKPNKKGMLDCTLMIVESLERK